MADQTLAQVVAMTPCLNGFEYCSRDEHTEDETRHDKCVASHLLANPDVVLRALGGRLDVIDRSTGTTVWYFPKAAI